nr:MAG TPA: hypothetical protein [Caudoviricetes sp.]
MPGFGISTQTFQVAKGILEKGCLLCLRFISFTICDILKKINVEMENLIWIR